MNYKAGLLFVTLLVGSYALPMPEDNDYFFYRVDASTRIVGGTPAATGAHRHMVGLSQGLLVRSFVCGGSLISPRTVLTAAHCIVAVFSGGSLSSTLRGTVGTNTWNSGGLNIEFARNVTHPNYVSSTIKNDIGLLISNFALSLNNLVGVIPLSYAHFDEPVEVRVAGWGRIQGGGALSATLLQVDLTTIRGQECVDRVRQAAIDFNTNAPPVEPHLEICTFRAPNFGTCNGDSGSALARRDNGQQVALVSWGFPCARGAPDMYARVSAFANFIEDNIV